MQKTSTYQAENQGQSFRQETPLKVKGLASKAGILNIKLLLNSALYENIDIGADTTLDSSGTNSPQFRRDDQRIFEAGVREVSLSNMT